ncbi:hypothetical protein ACSR0Z_14855 [Streptomyces viridosporus]
MSHEGAIGAAHRRGEPVGTTGVFLADVVPDPVERACPRSLRFSAGMVTFLSLIGLVVEIRMGLT